MLHDTFLKIVFYDIQFDPQTFELQRFKIDIDEVVQTGVRESVLLAFGRLDPILQPDAIPIVQPLSEDEGPPYLQN